MKNKPLSKDQIKEICDLYKTGLSQEQVAQTVGCSFLTVGKYIRKNGLSKRTTTKRQQIIELFKQGKTKNQIIEQLDTSYQYVHRTLVETGLIEADETKETKLLKQRIIELHLQGKTHQEIADEIGRSKPYVYGKLYEAGYKQKKAPKPDIKQIVALAKQGLKQCDIAKQLNTTVYAVKEALLRSRINEAEYRKQQIVKLHLQGMDKHQIAREINCHIATVHNYLRQAGLGKALTPELKTEMIELLKDLDKQTVADLFKCTQQSVYNILRTNAKENKNNQLSDKSQNSQTKNNNINNKKSRHQFLYL